MSEEPEQMTKREKFDYGVKMLPASIKTDSNIEAENVVTHSAVDLTKLLDNLFKMFVRYRENNTLSKQ